MRGSFRDQRAASLHYLKSPLAAASLEVVSTARQWFDADPQFSEFRGGRLIAELFPNLEHPLCQLLCDQIDQGREGIQFTLSGLRACEGEAFLHAILQQIVAALPENDDLRSIVYVVIESIRVSSRRIWRRRGTEAAQGSGCRLGHG
jgi:hypothetical protein